MEGAESDREKHVTAAQLAVFFLFALLLSCSLSVCFCFYEPFLLLNSRPINSKG